MENMIYWFTRNHVAANFLMLGVVVMGFVTWPTLKKEIFPETAVDVVAVTIPYPNATPAEVERGVCIPVEEAIQDVDGIDRIKSSASPSAGSVSIEVKSGHDIREVMDDVKTRVDAIDNFPEEAEKPTIKEIVLNAQVLSVAISADTDEKTLRKMADRLRDELLLLEEISKVELSAFRPYEISIEVSEDTLRSYGLSFDQVTAAVRASSLDLPAGSVTTTAGEVLVRTESKRYTSEDFERVTVFTRPDGSKIQLSDIATVIDGFEELDLESQFDGKRAILLNVFRVGNEDTLVVAKTAKEFIKEVAPLRFPEGVSFEVWKDDSLYLQGRLDLLARNAMFGLALVLLTLSIFLRPTLALLVAIGIPVSFLGAVLMMPYLGVSVNMISLFAFILVLGIVVDDAIVVGENVYERIWRGEDPHIAAPAGTHEVGVIVTFGVFTTMMAFTPMLGLSGVSGKIWPNIPLVVIPTLAWSLIQSKLVLPAHLALLPKHNPERKRNFIDRMLDGVDNGLRSFVKNAYLPSLRLAVKWRYVTLAAFTSLFIVVMGLVGTGWIKFQFFPDVEADVVISRVVMPEGVPFETTEAAVARMEAAANRLNAEYQEKHGGPIIRHMLASCGAQPFQEGFDQLKGTPTADNLGEVTMELVDGNERKMSAVEVSSRWRELTGPIAGALELGFQTQAAGGGNAIDLEITGNNLDELEAAADAIKAELNNYAGVIDIADSNRPGKRELKLAITQAGEAAGLRLADVSRQVRQAFYGDEAQRLQRGRDEVKVMIRYPEEERKSINNITSMKIRMPNGTEVPFTEVATFEYGRSDSTIQRADRRRAITITADVDKADPSANANEVRARLENEFLSKLSDAYPGVAYGFQGEQKDQAQSVSEISQKGLLALLGIYVLLAIPLRSYVQPIIVMSAIPFGLVGAVLGHAAMGLVLSIMSMCGVIALAGIVVNDSLVMVEFVNREREKGKSLIQAAVDAGARRFRPILLTSVTTFAGIMPMLTETDLQAKFLIPMAVSLGFGVLFATSITLVLVPSIYIVLEDFKRLAFALLGWQPKDEHEPTEVSPSIA